MYYFVSSKRAVGRSSFPHFSPLKTLVSAMAGAPEDSSFSPFSGSSPLAEDPSTTGSNSQINGTASDSLLTNGIPVDSSSCDELKYGFLRPEMNRIPLAGTVEMYQRHLFLCYKDFQSWPSRVEATESDRLPRMLAAALKSRKNEIHKKTRLTICEGRDGTENCNGDVLIFPDMIRYRTLTHFDVDSFVEDVLVKETDWLDRTPEALTGSHVFVCCHGSRDRRCGVCGPALVQKFKEGIDARGLQGQVTVSPCSHIGGHKYAGNLIIFGPHIGGRVAGHWYGYVTPDDVSILIDQHIRKGEVIDRLWRGQMGLSDEEQKILHEQRLQGNRGVYFNGTDMDEGEKELPRDSTKEDRNDGESCCRGANGFSCCRDEKIEENSGEVSGNILNGFDKSGVRKHGVGTGKGLCGLSLFETWDRGDTLAAIGMVGAVATIAVAYSFFRRSG